MLLDLLRTAPGAVVVDNGSRGAVASLFVRGGESNYTKVLLDGIPLNEPGGTFDFGGVTTENLERVEIVRGAQSALFGSDAMSGVVQMFTSRAPAGAPRADVMVEGGSFGTGRVTASAAGRAGEVDYSVGAARYSTNNEGENNEFDNTTLSGTAGLSLPRSATLRFTGRAELGRVGTPGQTAFGRPDLDAFFQRRNGVGGVTFNQQLTSSFAQRATYALSVSHQTSTNLEVDPPYIPSFDGSSAPFEFFDFTFDSHNELRRHFASYQADWRLPGTSGATGHSPRDDRARLGWRARAAQRPAGGDVRTRVAEQRRMDGSGPGALGACVRHRGVPRRAQRQLRDRGRAARLGRLCGAPVLRRRRRYQGRGLCRSRHQGTDAGAVIQHSPRSSSETRSSNPSAHGPSTSASSSVCWNDRARVELTWFANRYRDIISTRTITFQPFVSQYFNIGLTRARGAELSGELAPVSGVQIRGGYTLLASKILESTSEFSEVLAQGQPLFRRPRHSGYVGLAWTRSRLSADLTGVFVGRRTDSDFSALEPATDLERRVRDVGRSRAYRITGPLSITAAFDNLTGADYMEPLGYPALGRAVRVGAKVGF